MAIFSLPSVRLYCFTYIPPYGAIYLCAQVPIMRPKTPSGAKVEWEMKIVNIQFF